MKLISLTIIKFKKKKEAIDAMATCVGKVPIKIYSKKKFAVPASTAEYFKHLKLIKIVGKTKYLQIFN